VRLALFQLAQIDHSQGGNVLFPVLFGRLYLLDALLQGGAEAGQARVLRQDLGEDYERVAHLQVLLTLQAHDEALGEFVVPLVADVAEVLVVELFLFLGGLGGAAGAGVERVAEDGEEAREGGALGVENGGVGVPGHDCLEEAEDEAAVLAGFVVRETGDRVGDVRENL